MRWRRRESQERVAPRTASDRTRAERSDGLLSRWDVRLGIIASLVAIASGAITGVHYLIDRQSTPTVTGTGITVTAPGCEPGYSPCLPRAIDLNCSDIPKSKKPIRVTGRDPYRLDGNGNGLGCE
jgi:hypothetical protein